MKNMRSSVLSVLLGICILSLLTACAAAGRNAQNQSSGTGPGVGNLIGENNGSRLSNNPPGTKPPNQQTQMLRIMGFDMQKADNFAKQLGNIDGVSQINTVVNGNTALVGYKPTGASRDANAIKSTIAGRIKQMDKSITNVYVSDSADVSAKISQISNEIKNNRAGGDLVERFNKLVQTVKSTSTYSY